MRAEYKLAILKSGRFQYEIAQLIGVTENRLSKFVKGRGELPPDKLQRLEAFLAVNEESQDLVGAEHA